MKIARDGHRPDCDEMEAIAFIWRLDHTMSKALKHMRMGVLPPSTVKIVLRRHDVEYLEACHGHFAVCSGT